MTNNCQHENILKITSASHQICEHAEVRSDVGRCQECEKEFISVYVHFLPNGSSPHIVLTESDGANEALYGHTEIGPVPEAFEEALAAAVTTPVSECCGARLDIWVEDGIRWGLCVECMTAEAF